MTTITASVGKSGVNRADDVRTVQTPVARHADWIAPLAAPAVSGVADDATLAAIAAFQKDPGALLEQDGRVDPGGFTLRWMSRASIPKRQHPVFADGAVTHIEGKPADADYEAAGIRLGCEVAAIKAVSEVETGEGCWPRTAGRSSFSSVTTSAVSPTACSTQATPTSPTQHAEDMARPVHNTRVCGARRR